MPPGDEKLGKTELTLSAQSHPSLPSSSSPLSDASIKVKPPWPWVSTGSESGTQKNIERGTVEREGAGFTERGEEKETDKRMRWKTRKQHNELRRDRQTDSADRLEEG